VIAVAAVLVLNVNSSKSTNGVNSVLAAAHSDHTKVKPEDGVDQDAANARAKLVPRPADEEREQTVASPNSSSGSCGVERWSVKTGTDADKNLLNLSSTTSTTIAFLRGLQKPGSLPSNNRIQPTETTQYKLSATLVEYKLESDSDYHLVIKDANGNTMITEIPDPLCVASGSVLTSQITNARNEFNAKYNPTTSFQTANVPVTITGIGYFDFLHGQTGVAPNGVELHAVTDVQFSGGGGGSVTVANPGSQTGTVGTAASLQMSASDTAGGTLSWSATGLPTGLSINSSTGLISGTPTTAAGYNASVTATDSTGPSGSTSFAWTISAGTGGTVAVNPPGNQTSTAGVATSLQMSASDTAGGTLSWSATGLPVGLSINSSSGLISGTPTTPGTSTVTVTAKDSKGPSGSAQFTWTIASSGGCTAQQLLGNPGFETGSASPWATSTGVINNSSSEPPHSGSWDAWLDGYGTTHTDTLSQAVTLPTGCNNYNFSFWLHIDTAETSTTTAYDTLTVQVLNSSGTVLATLATYSNLNAITGYAQHSFSLSAYAGQTVTLKFTGAEDYTQQTSFVLDDTAMNVS
jgi:hypothetical protein